MSWNSTQAHSVSRLLRLNLSLWVAGWSLVYAWYERLKHLWVAWTSPTWNDTTSTHHVFFLQTWPRYNSLVNLKGTRRSKLAQILTPTLFNSIWMSGCISLVLVAVAIVINTNRYVKPFDKVLNRLFSSLTVAADTMDRTHEFYNIPVDVIFAERAAVYSLWNGVLSSIKTLMITWAVVASITGIVSHSSLFWSMTQ